MSRPSHGPVLLVAIVLVVTGCGDSQAPRTVVTQAGLERLRAAVPRLRPGMSRPQVFAALDVKLDGLPQIGTGPTTGTTTIYVLGGPQDLYLTWNATRPDDAVLVRAELVTRGLPPVP